MSSQHSTKFPHLIVWEDPQAPELPRYHAFFHPLEGLVPALRDRLAEALSPEEKIHTVIVAPSQRLLAPRTGVLKWLPWVYRWEPTPDWVLVVTEKRLLTATLLHPGAVPVIASTLFTDLLALEMAEFLLFCWFEWTWLDQERLQKTRIYFNGVSERYFEQIQNYVRLQIGCGDFPEFHDPLSTRPSIALPSLEHMPLKFVNYGRRLLLPGEQVYETLFQPEIWATQHTFLRKKKSSGVLVLLTSQGVSMVQEEFLPRSSGYGMTSDFYPRRSLCSADIEKEDQNLRLKLGLRLQDVAWQASLLFEPRMETELEEFIHQVNG